MMKVDRALKEVWSWKDEIYRLNKGKSIFELVKLIKREAASERFKTVKAKKTPKKYRLRVSKTLNCSRGKNKK